jgi:two-component system response regulator GlrR
MTTIEATPRRRKSDLLLGACPEMRRVLEMSSIAAASTHPVFLHGESGTGKELVARTIHSTGLFASRPFLSIHCGVIPDVLLEGELFGFPDQNPLARFTRGAGLIAEAAGGTIFLDQVEALPRKLQSRLITVLAGEDRMGGAERAPQSARLIAASARDLAQGARDSIFDPDLLEGLRAFTIDLPTLRDRGDDIQLLAAHFLKLYSQEIPTKVTGFSPEAQARMREYTWPGNVRELENKVRQAIFVARGELVQPDDLFLQQTISPEKVPPFKEAKRQFEKQYISQVLRASRGNISRAARLARKDRKDFYDVMRRNGIDPRGFRVKDGPSNG